MQEKKEVLKTILTKLIPYRKEAKDFLLLIDSPYATHDLIDSLILKINQTIKVTEKNENQKIMLKGLEAIKKIKELEAKDDINEKELDLLIDGIQ